MRYYRIDITKADGSIYQFKSLGGAFGTGTSLTSLLQSGPQNPQSGLTNPAALLIELDIAVANVTDPDTQSAHLRVWGLGLEDLGSASDLNGLSVAVYAGMAKGLPLANPSQAGLIMKGEIFQAYGNWVGTDQTLDMIFSVGGSTVASNGNFPFLMPAGTTLAQAVTHTLSIGAPNIPANVNISPNLTLNYDQVGHYGSFSQFADFVRALSMGIIGGTTYDGVQITTDGNSINVFDGAGTTKPTPKVIAFQDLLGQPTWIGANLISFKTVMRADIHQSDIVTLPQTAFTQTSASNQRFGSNPQDKLSFSGDFQIQQAHHYGNSRQADSSSWNTTFQAVFVS